MRVFPLLFLPAVLASAQTPVTTGYNQPGISIAPGQVVPLWVSGLKSVLPSLAVEAQSIPLPESLAGISVTLQQNQPAYNRTLPIFSVRQFNQCEIANPPASCLITLITVQIPYDINVPNPMIVGPEMTYTTLTITEGGAPGPTFTVSPVAARIHILQTCDAELPNASGQPCYPLVTHADGTLVLQDVRLGNGQPQTHTEARGGETLVMYAYGLGAVSPAVPAGVPSPLPPALAAPPIMRYDYLPNGGPAPPIVASPMTNARPLFAGLTPGQIGLYQINFVVPLPPPGTPACGTPIETNLTVSVAGAYGISFDGAAICVDPGP